MLESIYSLDTVKIGLDDSKPVVMVQALQTSTTSIGLRVN